MIQVQEIVFGRLYHCNMLLSESSLKGLHLYLSLKIVSFYFKFDFFVVQKLSAIKRDVEKSPIMSMASTAFG